MPFWFFMTLGLAGIAAVVAPLAWLYVRVMERKAAEEALEVFPGSEQEHEQKTYELLRQLECYQPTLRMWSRSYWRHRRGDGNAN